MSISVALVLITAVAAVVFGPRILVWLVAVLIGLVLIRQSRRIGQELIDRGAAGRGRLDPAVSPSRAERRLIRNHFKLAIRQTELASLLPSAIASARSWADR